jgi:hypothetical protein
MWLTHVKIKGKHIAANRADLTNKGKKICIKGRVRSARV